jgi:hypothetical protein
MPYPDPVTRPNVPLLPTNIMGQNPFNSLVLRMAQDVLGLRDVRNYGINGQTQHGIDVVGVAADGRRHALQRGLFRRPGRILTR